MFTEGKRDTQDVLVTCTEAATRPERPHWALRLHEMNLDNVPKKITHAEEELLGTFLLPDFVSVCQDLGTGGAVDSSGGETEELGRASRFGLTV